MANAVETMAEAVLAQPAQGRRRLVAVVGAPGSGKSTLAGQLRYALRERGETARVVPMDGFHLDNATLQERGHLDRKGAPWTFDVAGFVDLCKRLKTDDQVTFPEFDRDTDNVIADAGEIGPGDSTVIVEGNYLLYDEDGWRDLAPLWDMSIRLIVPMEDLERRLTERWTGLGLDAQTTRQKVLGNDLPNAKLVYTHALPATHGLRPPETQAAQNS
ncbi:nucleoside/nucleotide kinase family protein [Thalassococcus sp. CAU 1522]|uniref:Nucleoside/nucleotide kinase family protein n=1 Tax=Thalassococcus arenae TaxID=2851652 RepID=A0ABS6N6K1_9RHOB|nr:nucleoside/nucleotide kinase family protein [Thalassococcus arenae]MBV2359636.1 nucleoside/nucleotide kinase family protein [Thalassococcus arenae]